jgi:hypothetical protein
MVAIATAIFVPPSTTTHPPVIVIVPVISPDRIRQIGVGFLQRHAAGIFDMLKRLRIY